MSREVKIHKAQEFRRGEWEDVFSKGKDGNKKLLTAKISIEHGELLTGDAEALAAQSGGKSTSMFRYVVLEEKKAPKKEEGGEPKPKLADLRKEYPEIKATSVAAFLEQVEALNKED